MGLKIIQGCDGCGTTRELPNNTPHARDEGGWRRLPLDCRYGDAREEQPVLCSPCRKRVLLFVESMAARPSDPGCREEGL